ncbi:hypothetical protein ACNI65_09460 [Roseateles sp. So40a]|uniref:hypothetical protein n=1 Tax=Roseateles sp. So40a TaxID=3400226 RepID=UPI003A8B4761
MRAALLVLMAAAALAACSSGPGAVRGPDGSVGPGPTAFEQAQIARAQEQVKDGQLADAAWTWESLTVLRPDNSGYRDSLAATRQLIDAGVTEKLDKARAAHKRGDLEGATTQYLGALALQPDNDAAADALRALEKERNQKSYLGKPARVTLRKAAPPVAAKPAPKAKDSAQTAEKANAGGAGGSGNATAASSKDGGSGAGGDRNELEHIAMLAAQGELDEPIRLLEKRAPQDRNDPSARRLLADLYVRKAEKISTIDKSGAVMLLQKCLRVDPKNARATALMRQLIDESAAKASPAPASPGAGTSPAAASAKSKAERK